MHAARLAHLVLIVPGSVLLIAATAPARGPNWWGLGAVAVSPDGKTVVTGRENRTLYVLDAQRQDDEAASEGSAAQRAPVEAPARAR